jgi:hypothetical protein
VTADELVRLRTLAANIVAAAGLCAAHQLGLASCGCDQGTPSDAWVPNVNGRLPPQMCPHASWSRKARRTWDLEDPPEAECDTCGTRAPASADMIGECLVARCPSCTGWTMFHSKPDSEQARDWTWHCEMSGDVIAREFVGISPGRACEQADWRASSRTWCATPEPDATEAP